jgi:predicted DNA-binding transcriptional regulator YafY
MQTGTIRSCFRWKIGTMLETSARLLRLLSLLQSTREWTGPELAERLGVTTRTVRKDIDRLRNLGYPVDSTRGTTGGYRLGVGAALPPLLLDDDEAVAIVVGLSQASGSGVTGTEEASVRAMTKLEQILPPRLRNRVNALRTFATRVPPDKRPPTVDAEILAGLANASRNHERVRIAYASHVGSRTRRFVDPHHLVNWGSRWYLVAWDEDRRDWRTFRVDRISTLDATGLLFKPRQLPEADIAAYIARNVSQAAWKHTATIVVAAPAEQVLERINPAVGTVEPIDEETCILRTGDDDLDTVAVYTGLLGYEFRVVSPPELVERLRLTAERYTRAIG